MLSKGGEDFLLTPFFKAPSFFSLLSFAAAALTLHLYHFYPSPLIWISAIQLLQKKERILFPGGDVLSAILSGQRGRVDFLYDQFRDVTRM